MTHAGEVASSVETPNSARRVRLSRRRIIELALWASGAAAFDVRRARARTVLAAQDLAPAFAEPPVIHSENGVLTTTLVPQPQGYKGLGTLTYGNTMPGSTLRLSPGDLLQIKLVNRLSENPAEQMWETNLHVHGLHVSPLGHGDNVFVHVRPGDEWDFEYRIPADHPAGLFWYHPHRHGNVGAQVGGGLAGAIIIEGDLDRLPQTAGIPERLLVLQGPFSAAAGRTSTYVVNGQIDPVLKIGQGERQRWRILNATPETFFNLQLDGHTLKRVSVDGNYLQDVVETDVLLLGPAERAEVLIDGAAPRPEPYDLRSLGWDGAAGFPLARLVVEAGSVGSSEAGIAATPLPTELVPTTDLRLLPVAQRREITFRSNFKMSHTADDPTGQSLDLDRIDQTVELGATEEWVIRNDSPPGTHFTFTSTTSR